MQCDLIEPNVGSCNVKLLLSPRKTLLEIYYPEPRDCRVLPLTRHEVSLHCWVDKRNLLTYIFTGIAPRRSGTLFLFL